MSVRCVSLIQCEKNNTIKVSFFFFILTKALTLANLGADQENAERTTSVFFVLLPLQSAMDHIDTISTLNIGWQENRLMHAYSTYIDQIFERMYYANNKHQKDSHVMANV